MPIGMAQTTKINIKKATCNWWLTKEYSSKGGTQQK
jgi:hypothetical protein